MLFSLYRHLIGATYYTMYIMNLGLQNKLNYSADILVEVSMVALVAEIT